MSTDPPLELPASDPRPGRSRPAVLGTDLLATTLTLAWTGAVVIIGVVIVGLALVGRHGGGVVQSFDDRIARAMFHHRIAGLVDVAKVLKDVGSVGGLAVVSVVAGLLLWRSRRSLVAVAPLVAFVGAELVVYVAKAVMVRPRPALMLQVGHETDWSFPSGHSTATAAVVVCLALVISRRVAISKWLAVVVALVLGAIMAASRLVLDVHFFTDVTTGFIAGAIWGALTARALPDPPETSPRR